MPAPAPDPIELEIGRVDLATRALSGADRIKLSPTEAKLLAYLAARPDVVVPKGELLTEVWGYAEGTRTRTLFATIDRLRKKVERDPSNPRHVVTIGRQGYAFRPLHPAPPPPAPAGADLFVGREPQLARLAAALVPGALVTVRGPAGAGKTRLARELVARTPERRAYWVDLAEQTTGPGAVAAIAAAVGLPLGPEAELTRHLRRLGRAMVAAGETLLVLDSADVVAEPLGGLLADWAPPRPAILTTSRRALGGPSEQVLLLQPLSEAEAEALFVARARDRAPDWDPGTAIAGIVRELEGLPLAIELAARWSRLLPADALLQRLEARRLPLQASSDDRRPARHHSLEVALRGSWDALDPAQQRTLAVCSVFRGGFDPDAAEAVVDAPNALLRLDALADHSLVMPHAGRLSLLDAVRRFAAARLAESPDEERSARSRHAAWYARLGEHGPLQKLARSGSAGLLGLAGEVPNLLAAIAHGTPDQSGRAAMVVARVRRTTGPVAEGIPLLEAAVARPGLSPALEARLWSALGVARRFGSDFQGALDAIERSVVLAEAHAPELLAGMLQAQGTALLMHRTPEEAIPVLQRAQALYQASSDTYGEAVILAELASAAMRAGRVEEAASGYERALRMLRRVGARYAEAIYLGNLAIAHFKRGRYEAAKEGFEASLALHRSLGGQRFEAQTLGNLGLLHVSWGRPDEGVGYYEASLRAAQHTGDRKDEGITLANLAWLQVQRGELTAARRHLDEAEDAADELQMPLQQADVALTRAMLHRREGNLVAASAQCDRAQRRIEQNDFGEKRAELRALRGLLCVDADDPDGAATWLQRADETAAQLDLAPTSDAGKLIAELREAVGA